MDTTTTPQQRIEADVKAAMKAGEKDKLGTLRMLLTQIKNERIRRQEEVDEAGFVSLVRKAIKQREEAAAGFQKGGREDMAAKEEAEKAFLAQYLPAQADEGAVRDAVRAAIAGGAANVGAVMGKVMPQFKGRADGSLINAIAREELGKGGS